MHHFRTLRHPRWEDFNYERVDNSSNRFFWFGNGMTDGENSTDKDRTLIAVNAEKRVPLTQPMTQGLGIWILNMWTPQLVRVMVIFAPRSGSCLTFVIHAVPAEA